VLDVLPPELDQAMALDLCMWSLLGHHGGGKYLRDIEPAVYRVHSGGVFSMQGERNRYLMTAQSMLCLARLYSRLQHPALADALLSKAVRLSGSQLGGLDGLKLIAGLSTALLLRPLRRLAATWWNREP
jgi:hypothetical protein